MAEFRSKWLEWEPAGKTSEGSVSFVSGLVGRSQKQRPEPGDECGKEGNGTQTLVGKEETGEIADSGKGFLFQERPSRPLTKLTKPPTEPETGFAELERDWAAAWTRAQQGFAAHGYVLGVARLDQSDLTGMSPCSSSTETSRLFSARRIAYPPYAEQTCRGQWRRNQIALKR